MLSSINFGHVEFIYFLSDWLFLPGKHTFIFITMEKNKCEAERRVSVELPKSNVTTRKNQQKGEYHKKLMRDKSNNK